MTWVLWDILIPLIASFALGTLLGWLLWRGSRKKRIANEQDVALADDEENSLAMNIALADSADAESEFTTAQVLDNSALREMEKANITLISERDQANQAFENIQQDVEKMQQRIAELEAVATETDPSEPADDTSSADAMAKVELTSSLRFDENDSKELEKLRSDMLQLTNTLDRERKVRRATELELLNFKNRHDKLANEFSNTVSVDEHAKELKDRDSEIESLRQQLDEQALRHEINEEDRSDIAVAEAEKIEAVEQSDEVTLNPPDDQQISVAISAGIEPADSQDADAKKLPTKNGHVPRGWTVPTETPSSSQRDKLTAIKGVGPVLEKVLHECGIYYYRQVANLDESGMEELQLQIPQFPGRIERDKWVEQARVLQQKNGETI